MKTFRIAVIITLAGLFIAYVFVYKSEKELIILYILLSILVSFSGLLYQELLLKIKKILKGEAFFSRGLPYCLTSLPILYSLLKAPTVSNYLEQVFVYIGVLLLCILNFGISIESPPTD